MVRIKGENSDYKYNQQTGTIQAVQPLPEQLYLQLFVCPYDHPSPVEANQGEEHCCQGTDSHCPQATAHQPAMGHALVRLDQKTGISLVTDRRNQIVIDQSGKIQLCPASEGRVEVHGPMVIQTCHQHTPIQLEVSDRGICLQVGSARVDIDLAGNLNLTPSSTGKVKIHGDVEIQGQLSTQLSESLTQSITQSILTRLEMSSEVTV